MAKLKRGTVLWSYLSLFHVSRNVVFRKHRSIVELSHFYSSLTTSFVLEILPNESQDALNPPLDFSIQPLDIFYASLGSPLNEQVEDEQVNYELPNFELGSPTPIPPEDLPQDIPSSYSTQVRSIPTQLR